AASLDKAEALFEAEDYEKALIECVNISRIDPSYPGLEPLRNRIIAASLKERAAEAPTRRALTEEKLAVETSKLGEVPVTFKMEKVSNPLPRDDLHIDTPLRLSLEKPVSMHLKGADLGQLIGVLSGDTNINMIADAGIGKGKTIDIDIDHVPLKEVLDYISRNMGVDFYLGRNVIWVTAKTAKNAIPLETRIYQFRRGLQFHGKDWGAPPGKEASLRDDVDLLRAKATILSEGTTYIEELISQFVEPRDDAKLYLDRNTHTLFVRNTRANLEIIEEIIEKLDVNPPQVFIEARFIETNVADLRQLGLEWVLDSPWIASKKAVLNDGVFERVPRTAIQEGSSVTFEPFRTDDGGPTPLGPQGAFGLNRSGVPDFSNQGLNLNYQGILTKPMFSAVLHALDISGKGRTLSVPSVTTVNNNPAKLRHGEDLRYFEEFKAQAFTLLDDQSKKFTFTVLIPSGKPELEELGITLVAVPSVGADRQTINLLLMPTISQLEGFISYQDNSNITNSPNRVSQIVVKLPIISRREIQTKVVVGSGETVVMGGLIDTIKQETLNDIPFLSDVPLLGRLFSRTDVTEQNRNLLIFVTATVLSERGESLVRRNRTGRARPVEPEPEVEILPDPDQPPVAPQDPVQLKPRIEFDPVGNDLDEVVPR
ncbi:MAG: hypothetical protein AAF492_13895, partial [Verrucomicrobiota bacterium]